MTHHSSTQQRAYRWTILALCWGAFTMTSVGRATWGPAASSVGQDLGVAVAGLGLFAAAYYVGYVLSVALGGFLADWIGPRLIVGTSIFLSGGFMILFGQATSQQTGLLLQGVAGLCAGAEIGGSAKLIAGWFLPERRGFAMGIFVSATSVGLVVANAIVPSLIQATSWRTAYFFTGIASMLIGVLCVAFLRRGPHGVGAGAGAGAGTGRSLPNIRPLLHNRNLVMLALAGFGALWGTYGFITWANLLMVKGAGLGALQAGLVLVVFGAVAIFSKPAIRLLADQVGLSYRALTIAILGVFAATLTVFSFATNFTEFLWISPLLGIAAYVYTPLMMAMIPAFSGERLAGSATGGVNAFWQLGSAIVPAVIGMVFAATRSFQVAFLTLAAGPLLAIIPMLVIGRIHRELPDDQPGLEFHPSTRKVLAQ